VAPGIAAIEQLLDGGNSDGFGFGHLPGYEAGHLGKFADTVLAKLAGEVAEFDCGLWTTGRIA
jgi:hypothetical protein